MSVWDWNDVTHRQLPIEHPSAVLASKLVPGKPPIGPRFERAFEKRSGLPTLSIVEASASEAVPSLFQVLFKTGSRVGYVVEQGMGWKPVKICRRIDLDAETGHQIMRDVAMDPTMAFVDDTRRCAMASWWSDHFWLGLAPELFPLWLELAPQDFKLWEDEEAYPVPHDFESAKTLTLRRENVWRARMSKHLA